MRKFFTIMMVAMISLVAVSCDDRNDTEVVGDGDTYAVMKDISASFNAANGYTASESFTINPTDVVLAYRNVSTNSTPVWQPIPKTYYLDNLGTVTGRELDYNYDFTSQDIQIYTEANFDQAVMTPAETSTYLTNQRFRIVLVPASQGKNANVDYNDYESVIKYYNIKDRP